MVLNKVGLIRSGQMKDFYIKVVSDEDTGGFYILYSRDFENKSAEGYDEWYSDEATTENIVDKLDVEW